MIILNKQNLAGFIWDLSETLRIPLGRFAPYIFEKMMGFNGEKIDPDTSRKDVNTL